MDVADDAFLADVDNRQVGGWSRHFA